MTAQEHNIADKFVAGLRNAATEIEELQVQLALGKYEAKEVFEQVKKNFDQRLSVLKTKLSGLKDNPTYTGLLNQFEHLLVQIKLGITESKEVFEEQRERISSQITRLENELNQHAHVDEHLAELRLELEKFKAKLQLMSLHFRLEKVKVEYDFEKRKQSFHHRVDEIQARMQEGQAQARDKWQNVKKEMEEGFEHLKNIFNPKQ